MNYPRKLKQTKHKLKVMKFVNFIEFWMKKKIVLRDLVRKKLANKRRKKGKTETTLNVRKKDR